MSETTVIEFTVQYCKDDQDITGDFHAADDADAVRYWENDFCLLEMSRDADGAGWVASGGDSNWTELGELPFAEPKGGLRALFASEPVTLTEARN